MTSHPPSAVAKNHLWINRQKMGYTQKQLAGLIGHKTTAHISAYEHGTRLPTLETALKLEIALCIPVAFLYRPLYLTLKEEIQRKREALTQ